MRNGAIARRLWATLLAAGLLAVPAAASAHGTVRKDGNDTRGPLDLSSAAVGRKGDDAVTHTLTTFKAWKPKLLRNGSYFAVGFDTDGDPSDFERCAYAYYQRGLRGQLNNCGRRKLGHVDVLKENSRSIRFTIGLDKLLGAGGGDYRWAAFSFYRNQHACSKACGDVIPNHGPEPLHDLTPPDVRLRTFPDPTTNASPTTTFPVEFGVSDHGGSGIASWKLRQRPVGGTGWTVVQTGTDGGHQTVNATGAEGDQLEFQVIALDRQGNRTASSPHEARVTVPIDDADSTVVYSGSDWTTPAQGSGGFYLDSRHRTSVTNATATIQFTGSKLRILGGPSTATATLVVDTQLPVTLTETSNTGKRDVLATTNAGPGPHHAVITVNAGTFILDGYAVSDY